MKVTSAMIYLLVGFVARCIRVDAQFSFCDETLTTASASASSNPCNCPLDPVCGECLDEDTYAITSCINGCVYCDSVLGDGVCGIYEVAHGISKTVGASAIVYGWSFVSGRTGTLTYRYDSNNECVVTIDGQECSECTLYSCTGSDLVEPVIDCTNIEAGATASDPCSGRAGGGWASLDESAMQGVLAPLAIPYYGCQMGTTSLLKKDEEATSSPTSDAASTITPVTVTPSPSEGGPIPTVPTFPPIQPIQPPSSSGGGSIPSGSPPEASTTTPVTVTPSPSEGGPIPTVPTFQPIQPIQPSSLFPPTTSADPATTFAPSLVGGMLGRSSASNKLVQLALIQLVGTTIYHVLIM